MPILVEVTGAVRGACGAPGHQTKRSLGTMSAIDNDQCPVCRTADVISGKWTLLVIRDLAGECRRFCELERSLEGISPRTLSLRLRTLEEAGIVERQTFPEVPPRVTYALTEKGQDLVPLIDDMRRYGIRWLDASETKETVTA